MYRIGKSIAMVAAQVARVVLFMVLQSLPGPKRQEARARVCAGNSSQESGDSGAVCMPNCPIISPLIDHTAEWERPFRSDPCAAAQLACSPPQMYNQRVTLGKAFMRHSAPRSHILSWLIQVRCFPSTAVHVPAINCQLFMPEGAQQPAQLSQLSVEPCNGTRQLVKNHVQPACH